MRLVECYKELKQVVGARSLSVSMDLSSWFGKRYSIYIGGLQSDNSDAICKSGPSLADCLKEVKEVLNAKS